MFPGIPIVNPPTQVRRRLAGIYGLLIAANAGAWTWAYVDFHAQPTLLGMAALAYVFGLRHAFDADHIAAIDNVVRKLVQERRKPLLAGFFFSVGHSSVVVIASIVIAASAATVQNHLDRFQGPGGVAGTLVSACFLLAIGIGNLFILQRVWSVFNRARKGEETAVAEVDALLVKRGFLSRLCRPLFSLVSRSWHMYPIGILFGLGFDTATEVGLLGISASQAARGLDFWTIMIFPALFTAGMALVDTADSMAMVSAYGWAFVNPVRKLRYNMIITAASVAAALLIGGIEVVGLVADKLGLRGGVWDFLNALNGNLTDFGYAVVAILVLSWFAAILIYRINRYDDAGLSPGMSLGREQQVCL